MYRIKKGDNANTQVLDIKSERFLLITRALQVYKYDIDESNSDIKRLLCRSFWSKVFAVYKSILDNPNSSDSIKEKTSLKIGNLYCQGLTGWKDE